MNLDDSSLTIFVIGIAFGYLLWFISKISDGDTVIDRLLKLFAKRRVIKWKKQNRRYHNFEGHLDNKRLKFFGFGSDGTALSVELYTFEEQCEVNFALKLKNEVLQYHFTATLTEKSYEDSITIGSLTIQKLKPFEKWRITFNGILPKNNFGDESRAVCCEKTQHVIFTFFWTAASDPMEWPNEWSPSLLTTVFANADINDHLDDLLTVDEGFDQFGSLFGQVSINDNISNTVIELNLPGVRMVCDVKSDQRAVVDSLKIWTLVGTCKDGIVFTLSAKEIGDQPKVYKGSVRKPNMNIYSIEATNFNFKKVENEIGEISFNLKTVDETFQGNLNTLVHPIEIIETHEFNKSQQYFLFDLNEQPGFGTIITHTRYSTHKKVKPFKSSAKSSSFLEQSEIMAITVYTLFFTDVRAQNEGLSGGKGASLAHLTKLINDEGLGNFFQNTFAVPSGFILTTAAFNFQLERNEKLQYVLQNLETKTRQSEPSETLHPACEMVQKLFIDTPLEKEIMESVKKAIKSLSAISNVSKRFAVRSSAVGEDGAELSSAGQNETFLGLQGYDDILLAIQKCWASLFSVQSVSYRVQNIQPIRTAMAVVIQIMVPSECAGVLFTSHPSRNDPSKLLITANYGLGESVVSGSIDPDVFVVQRTYNKNSLKIMERNMGSKTHLVQMASNNVSDFPVSDEDRLKFCITDENLLKLCEIGICLQKIYNSPRDIEWAVNKDQIYLLQSRPMTSTNVFSAWELLHEFDTAVMSDEEMFTFGNVGEVMPHTMTPLTTSILISSFEKGLLENFPMTIESKYFNQLMNVSHHRLSINVFMMFMRLVKKEISVENRAHGITIFGHEFVSDEIHRLAKHRFGLASKFLEMQYIWNVIKASWTGNKSVRELEKFIDEFNGTYSKKNLKNFSSLVELYDDISTKLNDRFSYVQSVHGLTTMLTTCFQIFMFSTLSEGKTELSTESMTDIAILLSSCTDAESAEIPVLLEEIANTIISDNTKAIEFAGISPSNGVEWMRNKCIAAYTLFKRFIDKHSHRGLQEFDFGYETWGMNPALVIEMLQSSIKNLQSNGIVREKKKRRSNEEILANLKTPTRSSTRRVLGYFLPRCQKYVQMREKTKSILISYIDEIRKAILHLGGEMKMHGYLPDKRLIFHLTHNEIGKILTNRNRYAHLVNKATRRRRMFAEWNKLQFDEFQWGIVKPKDGNKRSTEVEKSVLKITGTPVFEGILTGHVCVVRSFSEVSKIKRGDILIAYSTDIAWSPYFPILSGVVTELGGLISHGAVVAREYGLPCIVGATNATSVFSDGDVVRLDANNGFISKIGVGESSDGII